MPSLSIITTAFYASTNTVMLSSSFNIPSESISAIFTAACSAASLYRDQEGQSWVEEEGLMEIHGMMYTRAVWARAGHVRDALSW